MSQQLPMAYRVGRWLGKNAFYVGAVLLVYLAVGPLDLFSKSPVQSDEAVIQEARKIVADNPVAPISNPVPSQVELCNAQKVERVAAFEKHMAAGRFSEADNEVRLCGVLTADAELQAKSVAALTKLHLSVIQNQKAKPEERSWAIGALQNINPEAAKPYLGLVASLDKRAESQRRAAAKKEGVSVGMTANQVLESSWGKPTSVNRSVYSFGVHEQWVYGGGNYIFLKDGVVESIMTSQ